MPVVRCSSPSKLLELLHQAQSIWGLGKWYYRGQGQIYDGLVPSLFRSSADVIQGARVDFEKATLDCWRQQIMERTAIPDRLFDSDDYLMALAQHYGGFTRMLDWTLNPLVAAYFAASGALAKSARTGPMVVYAMAHQGSQAAHLADSLVVMPMRGANENLSAQNGVLIKHDWKCENMWRPEYESPIESDRLPAGTVSPSEDPHLCSRFLRLELDAAYAKALLEELDRRGVDAINLFPGMYGFGRAANDAAWKTARDVANSISPPTLAQMRRSGHNRRANGN